RSRRRVLPLVFRLADVRHRARAARGCDAPHPSPGARWRRGRPRTTRGGGRMTSPVQTTLRLAVLGLCLLAAAAADAWARRPEIIAPLVPLQTLPTPVGAWSGLEAPAFAPEVVAELGVDEYVNRIYLAGSNPVSLYRSEEHTSELQSRENL